MEILYEFTGQSDGCYPDGQLTMDSSGALYGVTNGLSCSMYPGSVFKLSPSGTQGWTLETIYQAQGAYLNMVLALDTDGNVYGTSGNGAFELVKPTATGGTWAVVQIASIAGGPTGGLQFYGGNLYGTTQSGGSGFGSVFELSPPSTGSTDWTVSQIVSFQGGTDGSAPGNVTELGISVVNSELIFGVTQGLPPCSAPGDCGTVYELQMQKDGSWVRSVIYLFDGTDGAFPLTVTASQDGNYVFGTTAEGTGAFSLNGSAFELSATAPAPAASGGASWLIQTNYYFSQWPILGAEGDGAPLGNVLIDDEGLGVYLTPQGADTIVDAEQMIPIVGPYVPAGYMDGYNPGVPCIEYNFAYSAAAGLELQLTNQCSRRVDFWSCPGLRGTGTANCSDYIEFPYYPNFLDSNRSITVAVDGGPNPEFAPQVLECQDGMYPIDYMGALNPILGCGVPGALTPNLTSTTTTLTPAPTPNPSVYGEPVTLSATVSSSGSAPADGENIIFMSGTTWLGTAQLASGVASLTITALTVGTDSITADYGGDLNLVGSTSTVVKQVVGKTAPTINWPTPSPITYGTALSATQLNATSTVAGSFVYTPAAGTLLGAGTQTLSATFTPTDATDDATATSSVNLMVSQAAPAIALASSANSVYVLNPVIFTATVTSPAGTPTGTVAFYDGMTLLGSATMTAGVATYTTSLLLAGTHSITAVYSGDTNFVTETSSVLSQLIENFTIGSAGGTSSVTASPGGQAVYTFTVTPPSGTTFAGPISFSVTGLPAGATAAFSPTTVLAGAGATTVTMTVTLPATAAAQPAEKPFPGGALPVALGLILLPFGFRLRRRVRGWAGTACLLVIGVALAAGVTACGGGGSGSGGGSGGSSTPQNYVLTVTASAGSLSNTFALGLTVE